MMTHGFLKERPKSLGRSGRRTTLALNCSPAVAMAARDTLTILTPPPSLTVSQWSDANRQLSSESSAEPGRWRTDRVPYMRGIMDALNAPSITRIVVSKAAQVGYTEAINNVLGYFMDQDSRRSWSSSRPLNSPRRGRRTGSPL